MMNAIKGFFVLIFVGLFLSSCAPVKFSKSDTIFVKQTCESAECLATTISCNPQINSAATTFTYATGAALPGITSNCSPSNNDYTWTVKRADSSEVSAAIPGLSGENPTGVNFTSLGSGTYYVFLTASQSGSGFNPYVASTPLEFIVPGVGNGLTCDPKLNATLTSVTLNQADANAVVSANCSPAAGSYMWTATKDNVTITIPGLSGATSTPDIKALGVGVYKLSLYATTTGSQHWQSSTPLTVNVAQTAPPVYPPILCSPRINASLTSLTLTSASPNPLISANCIPSDVQYVWSVTKNGNTVALPSLAGANSNPNFMSLGTGTYLVYLLASGTGKSPWNTTTPLTITVDTSTGGQTLSCAPRLNGTSVSITVALNGTNPVVTSGCMPSTVTHTWSVFKAGAPITIAGLAGPTSNANFTAAGLGTYYIYLTASAAGYNTYVSPSPLEVTVAAAYNPYRNIVYQKLVQPSDNKVDILMVFDDSNSMAPDNAKLAQRLQNFVSDLTASGIDWNMCATVTRGQDVNSNGVLLWGASRIWVNYIGSPAWILKLGATDPYSIFTNTVAAIGAGWAGTDDERGIKAAFWHAEYSQYNTCYRNDASLSVIMISDEDERSVGGDASQVYYQGELKTLEEEDQPQAYINKIKQKFGNDKRFTFNSIIVKPGDAACMAAQDADGSKSHYGYKYSELSQLTNGATGSICAADYSTSLYYFKDRIVNSLASIPLECAPVGDVAVTITPALGGVMTQLQNNNLSFNPAIPVGRTIKLEYKCAAN
jgi:hypothetical protein